MVTNSSPLFLEVADRIGHQLCRDAMWDRDRCSWLGWSIENVGRQRVPAYVSVAADLYGGTSGIALFLADLYQFTQDKQQLRVIEAAINQAISIQDRIPAPMRHGFYTGVCGIAYAFIRIGGLLERELLVRRGEKLLDDLRLLSFDKHQIDVIAGSAGAIPAILHMAKTLERPDLVEWAIAHGTHLLALAETSEHGLSWRTLRSPVFANLTGHSHGTAGIATAFLELFRVSGDQGFFDAALGAWRYERHWFSEEQGNWQDLRNRDASRLQEKTESSCAMAWCHGAPGIGLSRLRNWELLGEGVDIERELEREEKLAIKRELDIAIATTASALSQQAAPGQRNYSLCHGASGNAELLLAASDSLGRPDLINIVENVAYEGYQSYTQQNLPWPCGTAGVGENPGLMVGVAGIGHFYLRLHDAQKVPSILLIKGA